MQTFVPTGAALALFLVASRSVLAFVPGSHHRTAATTTTKTTKQNSSYLPYRQRPDHDDNNNHHDDDNDHGDTSSSSSSSWKTPSSSKPTPWSNSIQQLEMDDRLLSDLFDVPSLQQWLYHGLSKVQSSDVSWLQSSSHGDILTVSPMSLIADLLNSLFHSQKRTTTTIPIIDPPPSLPVRMKFRFELQRCLLKALSSDPLALADVLQMGQSNTHPLGYSLLALPPHSRLPLAIVPSLHCTTVLTGNLCIQQASLDDDLYWDPNSLCRQWHHCVGTPLSQLASPPTQQDLAMVAQDVQQRVDEQLVPSYSAETSAATTTTTTVNQEPLLLVSPFTTATTTTTPITPSIKLHRRQYASAGSFVAWKTGTMVSMSTHEQPCLVLCLSSQLPTIHYKPPPPPPSSTSPLTSSSSLRSKANSNLHSRLFPPRPQNTI